MRRHFAVLGATFAAIAAAALFMGWLFFQASRMGPGWRTLGPVWPYVAGGVLTVGVLAAVFMWLAFYSARHGFDDIEGPRT